MKNKILGMLALAVGSFGLIASVNAATTACDGDDVVAKIGEDCYASLNDAVAAVSGSTETTIVLQNNIKLDALVKIQNNQNIVIDLNSYDLTREDGVVLSVEGAQLKVTGSGTVETIITVSTDTAKSAIQFLSAGTNLTKLVVDENVTVKGPVGVGVIGDRDNANLTQNMQLVIKGTLQGVTYNGVSQDSWLGTALSVNGQIGKGNPGGFESADIKIENTAKLTSTGTAIYQAGDSAITINGASVEGKSGIITKAGSLILNGAKVHAYGPNNTTTGNTGGYTTTGAAIQVESNNNYTGKVSVEINGGEYTSDNSYAFNEYLASGASQSNVVDIEITEGTFISHSPDGNVFSVSEEFNNKYEEEPFIAPGTVFMNNDEPADDVLVYTAGLGISESGVVGTVYTITSEKTENGEFTVNKNAAVGETVKVNVEPAAGYKLGKISVTYEVGGEVKEVEVASNGSFVMPEANVKVSVSFEKIPTTDVTTNEAPATFDNVLGYVVLSFAALASVAIVSKKVLNK